jgi:predicted Zn-dependent protease
MAQQGFGVYFLKFSREYEGEADILGAQIMARAGYDPHDLANMFRTLQAQGGGGGGFLSDHPSASDRYVKIDKEAAMLHVNNPIGNSPDFLAAQRKLRGLQRAQSMAEIQKSGRQYPASGEQGNYPAEAPQGRVERPSTQLQNYSIFNGGVQVSVPSNWRQLGDQNNVWFAPEGGYGQHNGQAVFTHGVTFGAVQSNSRDLQGATQELINNFAQGNQNLKVNNSGQRTTLSGRTALAMSLTNLNEATGQPEHIRLITTQLRSGQLFYMVAVSPQNDNSFNSAFQSVFSSVRIND